jgi:predicted amidohydrolase YtcJ
LNLGIARETLDLRRKRKAEILALVRDAAAASDPGAWLRGRSWDQNLWSDREFPTASDLSAAAPRNPVSLTRVDGHALWVNQEALLRAGITDRTPDPDGGRIERDASGKPTGILVDQAMERVERVIPARSAADLRRCFAAGAKACAAVGLTGIGDASGYDRAAIGVLRAMAREGTLPLRVYATVGGASKDVAAFFADGPFEEGRVTVRAVKILADGALGSRSAAFLADYSDAPGERGILVTAAADLNEATLAAVRAGWQVWIHAIGDRANRLALDACERALAAVKPADARLRIEHAQHLAPKEIARFAKLGVVASVQPTHATSDMPWAEARVGGERIRRAYAWRTLLAAGARLAGGSDFPVERESPLLGIYAAVTRQDPGGRPAAGWYPDQRLTRREALQLFTGDAAYAAFAEARRGRIAPGFDADLTILDRDLLADELPPAQILKSKIVMTIVGGEIVHN